MRTLLSLCPRESGSAPSALLLVILVAAVAAATGTPLDQPLTLAIGTVCSSLEVGYGTGSARVDVDPQTSAHEVLERLVKSFAINPESGVYLCVCSLSGDTVCC